MERKNPEFVKNELNRRAAVLAQPPVKKESAQDQIEVMTFMLASERYALETSYVREVWPLTSYIPVPHTPSFVLGVTNVHGQICSIVDLKQFFSLPSSGITNLNKLVILENGDMCFGILADEVLGTESLAKGGLSSADEWRGIDHTYLTGITCDRLIVLNAERILADKRLVVNETVEV
jgi:purine-binding chemotaxis protein CheW